LFGKFYSRLAGAGVPNVSPNALNDKSSNKAGACENILPIIEKLGATVTRWNQEIWFIVT
jgi:hypothetical protein